jgi:uncharacterized protein
MMRLLLTSLPVSFFLVAALAGSSAAGPREDEASAYSAYRRADYATAMRLFRPLADQGRADARCTLGFMYGNGQGVPQNYSEAVKWYRLAADQGRADAQNNLGRMYDNGMGVPQDYVLAHIWFSLSAAQGYKDASKNRDAVAERMTPAQIAEAQKGARDWKSLSPGVVRQVTVAANAPTPKAHNQAPSEVDSVSPPVIGHASRPTAHDPDTSPNQSGEPGMFDSNGHDIRPPERGYLGPGQRRAQTSSPSLVDLGGMRPRGAYVSPYANVPTNYSAQLEARSMRIFPSPSQEPQRQQWMADQEQKAIENEINRSKPLLFPVNGRR